MSSPQPRAIPDFTDTERWVLSTTLRERYGRDLALQLADAEVRVSPADRELTPAPVVVWRADDGCPCVIFKTGERHYPCQVFDQPYQQIGTVTPEYEDLAECVVAVLHARADFSAEQRGDLPVRR